MKEQVEFCDTILADLARLFPTYPADYFTSNAASVPPGRLLQVTMPPQVARTLLDAFQNRP